MCSIHVWSTYLHRKAVGKILLSWKYSQVLPRYENWSNRFAFRWWCQCSRGATAGSKLSWKAGGRRSSRFDNLDPASKLQKIQGTESITDVELKFDLTEEEDSSFLLEVEGEEEESLKDFHSCGIGRSPSFFLHIHNFGLNFGIGRFRLYEDTLVYVDFCLFCLFVTFGVCVFLSFCLLVTCLCLRFRLYEDTLVCVDGQQRLTTTSLLVAAIRCFNFFWCVCYVLLLLCFALDKFLPLLTLIMSCSCSGINWEVLKKWIFVGRQTSFWFLMLIFSKRRKIWQNPEFNPSYGFFHHCRTGDIVKRVKVSQSTK